MIQSLPALRQQFIAESKQFYQFPDDDPRKATPLSLERQKKYAKALLKSWRHSQELALLQEFHPNADTLTTENAQLADGQLVVARQHGYPSWPKFKHHLESAEIARRAVASGKPIALDADKKTLHIRCGNDVMYKLAVTGFCGDFLSFSDPYIQGPVPVLSTLKKFVHLRADFISGASKDQYDQAYQDLMGDYLALESGQSYERIAFWFEHDAYDVLIFLKLLHFFSEENRQAADMRYICIDHYPGVKRFNGIGQLPAEAMRILWQEFKPITEAQFQFGKLCWQAYSDNTPEALAEIVMMAEPPLAVIIPALKRHLRELPWLSDGLSLSERITLQILKEQGDPNAADLFFHWYTCIYEPLPFMGDSSYWLVLEALRSSEDPAIAIDKKSDKKIDWAVSLTSFGEQLLAGFGHWTERNHYDRWFGGTHNYSPKSIWYWDEQQKTVTAM